MAIDKTPSEFGGAPGLIQPLPHNPTDHASEAAMLERQVDPSADRVTGETDSVELVLARHMDGTYGRQPVADAEIFPLMPDIIAVGTYPEVGGFRFVGVGNIDLRTARIKAALQPTMVDALWGPEVEISPSIAPMVDVRIGSLASGKWYFQMLMNGLQVTEVGEVEVP